MNKHFSEKQTGDIDPEIVDFLSTQIMATVCSVDSNSLPQCFNCRYFADTEEGVIIFKSSPGSLHIKNMMLNPFVSGTILPAKQQALMANGIRFSGVLTTTSLKHKSKYYVKHPAAISIPGEIYGVRLTSIKMTEKSPLHSRKVLWQSQAGDVYQTK